MNTEERLRDACNTIRRKQMPLADLIPMMQEAADKLAALEAENAALKADAERCTSECDAIAELNHAQWLALENVRTLAAKYRHEPWATHMLRFCEQAGNRAQTLRTARSKT